MVGALTISLSPGSDPDIEIDDAREVVGEIDGEVFEFCLRSPIGQCQYTDKDKHRCCIYCGKESGL